MVHVSGSLAFDRILFYQGKFDEHLKTQSPSFNISLPIHHIIENYGGTAGNIAYNISLLNEPVTIYAAAGKDFSPYAKKLRKCGISTRGIIQTKEVNTAAAYMLTDCTGSQLVGFFTGAMAFSTFRQKKPKIKKGDVGIISSGNETDMTDLALFYKKNKIHYIFDPSQQITTMTKEQLNIGLANASLLIANEHELARLEEKLGTNRQHFLTLVKYIIITRGAKGSTLLSASTAPFHILPVAPNRITDPTGSGDAYRAGLIKGLLCQFDIVTAAKVGSVMASFCIEEQSGQNHRLLPEVFKERYTNTFGMDCNFSKLFERIDTFQ